MNRGLFRASPPVIGDYNGVPPGGSWAGNRGRQHFDELRMFGYADGQRNWLAGAGGQRVINTNPQAQVGSIFAPGDLGMVINVLSGTVQCNNNTVPFASVLNSAGRIRIGAGTSPGNATPGGTQAFALVENNTALDNQPGIAANLPNYIGMTSTTFYQANGAACVVAPNADINSLPSFGISAGGTLTCSSYVNFLAKMNVNNGATLTLRAGFQFADAYTTTTAGTVTTQVGVDIAPIQYGTTNIGIRMFSGNTTYTNYPTAIVINPAGTVSTLNFANASIGNAITIAGTFSLSQSAAALAMGGAFLYTPTFKNTNGVAANFGLALAISSGPTFQADGATITGSTQVGFSSQAITSVINAGVLNGLTFWDYTAGGVTVGASTTVTTRIGYRVADSTNSGTLTTQVGVDILTLAAGTTNIGLRNASITVYTPTTNQTLAAATTVLANATHIKVIQTSGASITLTAAPTIAAGQDGQILHIVNVSTVAASAFVFQSVSSLGGSTLSLGATTRTVGIKGSLTLIYNATLSRWVEIGFNGGTFG